MIDLVPIAPKLGRLVRMLDAENDNEALAAARALGRALKGAGASFHDLAEVIEKPVSVSRPIFPDWAYGAATTRPAPEPEPDRLPQWAFLTEVQRCAWLDVALLAFDVLDEWQIRFVTDTSRIVRGSKPLTDRQIRAIDSILARLWNSGKRL